MAITIGHIIAYSDSEDWNGYTNIQNDDTANATGTLTEMKIHNGTGTGQECNNVKMGTFLKSGSNFTSRDYETVNTVAGLNEFTGLNCSVSTGDYIGTYSPAAHLIARVSSSNGCSYKAGDNFTGSAFTVDSYYYKHYMYATGTETAAAPSRPASPSIIVTVNRIA